MYIHTTNGMEQRGMYIIPQKVCNNCESKMLSLLLVLPTDLFYKLVDRCNKFLYLREENVWKVTSPFSFSVYINKESKHTLSPENEPMYLLLIVTPVRKNTQEYTQEA